jgi:hypothetical protein
MKSMDECGGPAYPITSWKGDRNDNVGMSLRDYFAGQAMIGILSNGMVYDVKLFASECYELAEAMLKRRGK